MNGIINVAGDWETARDECWLIHLMTYVCQMPFKTIVEASSEASRAHFYLSDMKHIELLGRKKFSR